MPGVSSLASQLAQNASLNASILLEKSRRKPIESYLFTGRDADQHDLESIHALGVNGYMQLVSMEPRLRAYHKSLFDDAVKDVDRTLLTKERIGVLDKQIGGFLRDIGPWLVESAAGKVLEWLVRRFRINEFNVEDVLALFLPYHESPHFAKMVTILHIKPNSTWSFLLAYKSSGVPIQRTSLIAAMLRTTDIARFIVSLAPMALHKGNCHRAMIAFHTACVHDLIVGCKDLSTDEGTVAYVLPALVGPLKTASSVDKDAILSSYILLCAFSQKCTLKPQALRSIISVMSSCAHLVTTAQFLNAVIAVCEPQDELDELDGEVVQTIVKLGKLTQELKKASIYMGVEKFLSPVLRGSISLLSSEHVYAFCDNVFSIPKLPVTIRSGFTESLLEFILSQNQETTQSIMYARKLLARIHQVYPEIVDNAVQGIIEQKQQDEDEEEEVKKVEQLMMSLTLTSLGSTSTTAPSDEIADMILGSSSADTTVRVVATRNILARLSSTSQNSEDDTKTLHAALLSLIQDPTPQILDMLFATSPGRETMLSILRVNADAYEAYLKQALNPTSSTKAGKEKPKKAFVKTHMEFLILHFAAGEGNGMSENIFHEVLFPWLVCCKSRQKIVESVWDILSSPMENSHKTNALRGHPWIAGCADIWRRYKDSVGDKEKAEKEEDMKNLNAEISGKIAENIAMSNEFDRHFEVLLGHLGIGKNQEDVEPYGRAFAFLVVRKLLAHLEGERQIRVAGRVMRGVSVDLEEWSTIETDVNPLDESSLGKAIVSKPSSKSTLILLRMAIMAFVPSISRPREEVFDWFCLLDDGNSTTPVESGSGYVNLLRLIYQISNSNAPSSVRMNLVRNLFVNLGEDALAFLAGVVVCLAEGSEAKQAQHKQQEQQRKQTAILALRHISAFLMAHLEECSSSGEKDKAKAVDFQVVLPALLVALKSFGVDDADVRGVVMDCVGLLAKLAEKKLIAVYGMDTFYGMRSDGMQFLDRDDYRKYLAMLVEHEEHLRNDSAYLDILHRERLLGTSTSKADRKKQAEFKQNIIFYLLSHVTCLKFKPTAQIILLEAVEDICDKVKAQLLLPVLEELVNYMERQELNKVYGAVAFERFEALVLGAFDKTIGGDVNKASGATMWATFLAAVGLHYGQDGSGPARDAIAASLEGGLFIALSMDRKVEMCRLLIKIGSEGSVSQLHCKTLLANLIQDQVPLIVLLLSSLQPSAEDQSSPAAKRTKLSEPQEDHLLELSLLAEILSSQSLPGSFDLIARLLGTLNHVVQYTPHDAADVNYVEQLLMSAIDNAAEKVTEVPNSTPSAIRLEILVELIRISDNPQTFHQALALMANLTRLAQDSALHNVMPVFTFMGSNIFHRDDAYSFNVVQKTIDNIVPVMVSSLQRAHQDRLELYIGARDFLRIFADAVNHIPRHRRTNFFTHLVDVLGPRDFLTPVCLLLVEKLANRIVRQNPEEAKASLSLVISLISHYPTSMRLCILTEILQECRRIVSQLLNPADTTPIFSEPLPEEHAPPASAVLKRRAQALLTFVGFAFKGPLGSPSESISEYGISDIVSHLTYLATVTGPSQQVEDIRIAANLSLARAMEHMAVVDFVAAVLTMMESGQPRVQQGALDLLSERLGNVSDDVRTTVSPTVNKIVQSIRTIILSSADESILESSYKALAAIGESSNAEEASSLTALIPGIITSVRARKLVQAAMTALRPLSSRLGPRLLPHYRDIISECVILLSNGPNVAVDITWNVLNNLLTSIPTFWGSPELKKVIELCISASSLSCGRSSSTETLLKSIAKRTPAKVLLPTLCDMWPSVDAAARQDKDDRVIGFFDLLKKSTRNADRPVVSEQLRPLFKLFLDAFEVTPSLPKALETAISAFVELVVKLNDTAFKPLFRRLFDWAFVNVTEDAATRKVTFCAVFVALLDFFKALMVPYMSFVLLPFIDLMKNFHNSAIDDPDLWLKIVTTTTKSISYDDTSAFWREDKLRQLASPLVQQLPVCIRLFTTATGSEARASLLECINVMVENITDDVLLKTVNLGILLHTRAEEARVRIFALTCSETLWSSHGSKLLGFASETATFIAECAEDDNDDVLQASVRLKNAVESVAGALSGL